MAVYLNFLITNGKKKKEMVVEKKTNDF